VYLRGGIGSGTDYEYWIAWMNILRKLSIIVYPAISEEEKCWLYWYLAILRLKVKSDIAAIKKFRYENESCDRKKTSFELVEWAYNKLLGTFSDIVPWLADFFKHWLLLRRMTKSAIPTPRRSWLAKSLSHRHLDLTRTQSFTRVIVWRSILTLFRLFGTIFFSFQSC